MLIWVIGDGVVNLLFLVSWSTLTPTRGEVDLLTEDIENYVHGMRMDSGFVICEKESAEGEYKTSSSITSTSNSHYGTRPGRKNSTVCDRYPTMIRTR